MSTRLRLCSMQSSLCCYCTFLKLLSLALHLDEETETWGELVLLLGFFNTEVDGFSLSLEMMCMLFLDVWLKRLGY